MFLEIFRYKRFRNIDLLKAVRNVITMINSGANFTAYYCINPSFYTFNTLEVFKLRKEKPNLKKVSKNEKAKPKTVI